MKTPPARASPAHQPVPCFGNSKMLPVAAASFGAARRLDGGLWEPRVCIHTRVSITHVLSWVYFPQVRENLESQDTSAGCDSGLGEWQGRPNQGTEATRLLSGIGRAAGSPL